MHSGSPLDLLDPRGRDKLSYVHYMGSFNNHVDKKGWVGGQPNVHVCPREVGRCLIQCPRGHFNLFFKPN